jgi:aminoglycoside phosphotransferase (APT) family kinase protein
MLNQADVVAYLLKKQWLNPEAIIREQLKIVNLSRRNWNFKVISTQHPCFFIKQGNGEIDLGTIDHEASMYEFFQQQHSALQAYLPHYLGYERTTQVLTLEWIRDAQDLNTYQLKQGKFPKYIAAEIAKTLAVLHRHTICQELTTGAQNWKGVLPSLMPWVLNAHRPQWTVLRTISQANLKLMGMLQKFPAFGEHLDALDQDWNPTVWVHGDIKFDNFIVYRSAPADRSLQLKLIDWEFAGVGDPCWDLGSVLSAYLKLWIFSIPITGEVPPSEFAKLAKYPLVKMQGAITTFWQTYCQRMALSPGAADAYLLKSVRLGAARLIQTALELTSMGQLTSTIICLLQLSLNMLKMPEKAATQLLGIPRGEL